MAAARWIAALISFGATAITGLSGRHVILNLDSVQRLDELHIMDTKKTYSVNLFDSISSPACQPNRIRLTNCSQASFVSFRNVENLKQVVVEGDVPSEQFLRYVPAGIDVQFQ